MTTEAQAGNRKISWQKLNTTQDAFFVREVIARETSSWEVWLLLSGFVQIVLNSSLDPVWGVILILIAAASHYFKSAAMLPVYGVAMAWAMVSNLTTLEPRWTAIGLLQAYWAFSTFRQFLMLRRATERLGIGLSAGTAVGTERAAGIFPWAGCATSALAPIALVTTIILMALWPELTGHEMSERTADIAVAAVIDLAVLGLALAVAAILCRFRWQVISIVAALGSVLLFGFLLFIVFLPS